MKYVVITLLILVGLIFLNRLRNNKKYQGKRTRAGFPIEPITYNHDKTTSTNTNKNVSFIGIEIEEINAIDEKDVWDVFYYGVAEQLKVNITLQFDYIDRNDAKTSRAVDVRGVSYDEFGILLSCHCHLRDEMRNFRPKRIKNCIDVEIGEIVANVMQHLQNQYNISTFQPSSV